MPDYILYNKDSGKITQKITCSATGVSSLAQLADVGYLSLADNSVDIDDYYVDLVLNTMRLRTAFDPMITINKSVFDRSSDTLYLYNVPTGSGIIFDPFWTTSIISAGGTVQFDFDSVPLRTKGLIEISHVTKITVTFNVLLK